MAGKQPRNKQKAAGKPACSFVGWLIVAVLLCILLAVMWYAPLLTIGALLLVAVQFYLQHLEATAHFRSMKKARPGESITTFAKSFDSKIDPQVVRAVYEELQFYVPYAPLRRTDEMLKDLQINTEDFEQDISANLSKRTGRTLEGFAKNPYFNKLITVQDVVMFFDMQPKAK